MLTPHNLYRFHCFSCICIPFGNQVLFYIFCSWIAYTYPSKWEVVIRLLVHSRLLWRSILLSCRSFLIYPSLHFSWYNLTLWSNDMLWWICAITLDMYSIIWKNLAHGASFKVLWSSQVYVCKLSLGIDLGTCWLKAFTGGICYDIQRYFGSKFSLCGFVSF